MEPLTAEKKDTSLDNTDQIKDTTSTGPLIDVIDGLPVQDKTIPVDLAKSQSGESAKSDGNNPEGESPEVVAQKTLQSNISKGMKRIQSFGVTLDRDVRQEQLTQLIAAKLREGELMIQLSDKNAWVVESESPKWTVHTKNTEKFFWIRNEISIGCTYAVAKELLIEYRKKRQVNTDAEATDPLEKISNICSINYERSTSLEPIDYLILRLERQAKEGCFKIAEMSIEDKRCPVIPGVKRGHVELRYWHLSPDEKDEKRCRLWIIECVKIKTKGDETEIKTAMERNKNLIQKVLTVKV